MQRWFFLQEHKKPKKRRPRVSQGMSAQKEKPENLVMSQEWVFTVLVPNLGPKERVYLSGSTVELGEWDLKKIVPLEPNEGTEIWSKRVTIPNTCDVFYRYAVCLVNEDTKSVIVRRWEVNIHPRVIKENTQNPSTDIFGEFKGDQKINRGWLTTQTLVQFKFMNEPLKLKSRLTNRVMLIKVTPVNLSFGSEGYHDDSQSMDTQEGESPLEVTVEVSTLDNDPQVCQLQPQAQFGREYKANDILLINVYAPDHKVLAYLIDFYSHSSRAATDDPPYHVGYTYVLPNMFKPSEGALELPVTCNVKHRPLGTVNFEYLIVYPLKENICNLQVSYEKHWDPTWTGLEVGHRGLGASFKTKEFII